MILLADTLETLEIKVEHSASGAAGEIKGLTDAISKLSGALTRALPKLKSFGEALANVSSKVVINDFQNATVNNIKESAKAQKAIKQANDSVIGQLEYDPNKSGTIKSARPEELQESIARAGKLEIALHKVASAEKKFGEAVKNGEVEKAWSARERFLNASAQAEKYADDRATAVKDDRANRAVMPLSQDLQAAISSADHIDILEAKLVSLRAAMDEAFGSGNQDKAYQLREQILRTEAALEKAKKAAEEAAKGIEEVSKASSKSNGPLSTFVASLKRIAFYRIIRSIIKAITQALQEGLEWDYQYSKGLSDAEDGGGRFAASMDRIKTASNVMKGQLGSAFISLLAAIEPILTTLIDLVTRAADAISQLFAAFTGTTYIKASANGLADAFNKGAGSAKAFKNQLMGFDEINRLNEPSGGGGGSSGLSGVTGEVTEIEAKWRELAERLRPIINGLEMMFGGLRDIVVGIFTGDWALAFDGAASIIEGFGQIVSGVLGGIQTIVDGLFDSVQNGILELGKKLDEKFGTDGTFEKIAENINKVLEVIQLAFDNWIEDLANGFEGVTKLIADIVRGDWSAAWEDAKNLMSRPTSLVNTKMSEMAVTIANSSADSAEAFATNQETIRDEMWATGNSVLEAVVSNGGISFIATIQNVVKNISRLLGKQYASGGWPSTGEIFVANEAGPEMVGTIGGRTAVATNNDIVEAIRQGVYDAVVAGNSGNGGDVKVQVYLDSREIKAGQQRLARAMGA